MTIEVRNPVVGVSEVAPIGEIDMYNFTDVKGAVLRLWNKGEKTLIVDLSGISGLDSSGIGALIYIYTGSRTRDLDVCFFAPGEEISRMFAQTRLDGYLPIARSRTEALMAVGASEGKQAEFEPIKELRVDPNSPLFDRSEMYFKEFHIDVSQVRRLAGLIVQQAPGSIHEMSLLEQQVSEIIKNGVVHGNKNDKTKALRVWFQFAPQSARLVVEDEGEGFRELEAWNRFYRKKIECYRENRFEEMMDYVSFRTENSGENDGGNALFAAIEYWNEGVVYSYERNAVAVGRRFKG